MRDKLDKALSLGIGMAVAGKEQVEKFVGEWTRKGEEAKSESSAYMDRLVQKGDDARKQLETAVRDKVQSFVGDRSYADQEEINRLERRLEALERREFADS
ncbi:phasin family protein [Paenibacillus sp. NEAU-GSW1]|uniref:phasin family protein n=1 Tax=Paenibacillus sp. NEAU-GSW1 TaxID=2682486 RepID=UPI0012E15F9B|nr:hypothetical protein [Paenibacillus sp. NEAU-GSW1]MUT66921.1 hypothetical protein [Paenibacillus sp. NEAU-GSW1]